MKNIITLIFAGLMIISCGSTKETEVQKPVVEQGLPKRESSRTPQKKSSVDPEQLAVQLGLSEEKTDEFVIMWTSADESMRLVRQEYKDADRKILFSKMQEVKHERDLGLERILTDAQLAKFYQIMGKSRAKLDPGLRQSKGN
jgi:hypothetical protein